jgi:hypothetical protein
LVTIFYLLEIEINKNTICLGVVWKMSGFSLWGFNNRIEYRQPSVAVRLYRVASLNPYSYTIQSCGSSEEPMQIISGAMSKEKVYFEAPPSNPQTSKENKLREIV